MQILPYTYSNPKTEFLGLFMFKCWPEEIDVIDKVVELLKTHLIYISIFMQILPYTYSNPKIEFLALFMFKYWPEEFDVIDKVVELFKTHL